MTKRPMNDEEARIAGIAQHRIELKRKLRLAGCPFDNDESTKRLEILIKFISK